MREGKVGKYAVPVNPYAAPQGAIPTAAVAPVPAPAPATTATTVSAPSAEGAVSRVVERVDASCLRVGAKVARGPAWKWGNQDGSGCLGVILKAASSEGWVEVKWTHNGQENEYRAGSDGHYDLVYSEECTTGRTVVYGEFLRVGARVKRGKDWKWEEQDANGLGTLLKNVSDEPGWVRVKWDEGRSNNYRAGAKSCFDLVYVSDDDGVPAGSGGTEARPVPEMAVTSPGSLRVGAYVVRGPSWEWDDQDGGVGTKGKITGPFRDGWVRVEWPSGAINTYRAGADQEYDLLYADQDSGVVQEIAPGTSHPSARHVGGQHPVPDLDVVKANCVRVGAHVGRGPDWKYKEQDGDTGNGTIISPSRVDGWVRVRWASGQENDYRAGVDENYDLVYVAEDYHKPESMDWTKQEMVLFATVREGARVRRGPDWEWGTQDGQGEGKVLRRHDKIGWVIVEWDIGGEFGYRAGDDDAYDLVYIEPIPTNVGIRQRPPPPNAVVWGKDGAGVRMGGRVKRGRDWKWGDQDGSGLGTIVVNPERDDGWVRVAWDNGVKNNYRAGAAKSYDLEYVAEDGTSLPVGVSASDAASAPGSVSAPSAPVVYGLGLREGAKVRRGADWKWGEQDHHGTGTVVGNDPDDEGWVIVTWDHDPNTQQFYRAGASGCYDMVYVDALPGQEEDSDDNGAPVPAPVSRPTGNVLWGDALVIGASVRRGPDWEWADQDGHSVGTIVRNDPDDEGWVVVHWGGDESRENFYRAGVNGKHDLVYVDEPVSVSVLAGAQAPSASTATSDDPAPVPVSSVPETQATVLGGGNPAPAGGNTPAATSAPAEAAGAEDEGDLLVRAGPTLRVGARVTEGPDWKWGDQSGTTKQGTVTAARGSSCTEWVRVAWDNGTSNTYRAGKDGCHDLVYVQGSPVVHQVGTSVSWSVGMDLPIGARVRRGVDWKWAEQDGNGLGTIVAQGTDDGWLEVKWDNGRKNSYRTKDAFDLNYA
ncbi:hypothetical protein KIPB_001354 [Kipferlia bialata]|uniref:MIB/HERC2 domain-containing protein n=1 Tax=Kipferlia bialata TaxID=797122 RepID=A0A9K3CQF0_9EUKA|nr:hypothetical protein KIPB_001354 [Kipferlia bialata]|eukprot:g1354.t1